MFVHVAIERGGGRRRWWRAAVRSGVAAALLLALGLRVGGAAFARGIDSLTGPVVIEAIALTALSTLCAAWRWRVVARQLGAPLPAGRAVTAYYRSQFLNSVLPGGVAGDAYRAIAHGRDVDDLGRAARAVVWDRTAGQIVQAVVTIAVLAVMPSPGRRLIPVLVVIVGAALVLAWQIWRGRRRGSSWPARVAGVVRSDLRDVIRRPVWPVLVVASLGVVVSHVALFVLVAHTVDPTASVRALVPLAVIVLIATGIPVSVAGWGLREGAAAWVFAAAGLG
ncbi:MAG TPA: lysylphosphatidylglycerol synthase transmembrane domain-containing protein, partial [Jatrophihabitantaceae bacterium]|nr:lysylphosphatidylglycerol synthase transmembrane domain-containing protein [Jatrophihabitantaceae bacterium]